MSRVPTRERVEKSWQRGGVRLSCRLGSGLAKLRSIARSRTEPASRVERARMLLAYREDPSFFAVGRALGLHHQTVQRCVERAVADGPLAALDDRPRPGKEPTITAEAKAWLVDRWPVARRRNWAIRTNCGRRGCWPAMRASMDRRRGMSASPSWPRARSCKILNQRGGEAAQGALLPGTAATPSLKRRWRRCCASIAR